MRFSMEEQLHRLAWMFLFAAVASIIVVFIWPQYGIDQASVTIRGNIGTWWQGIYHQKAVLGRHMSLATLIFFFLLHQQHWKWIIRFGFVSCLLLLYLTSSRTAQAALIVSLASLPFIILLRRRWHFTLTIPLLIVSLAMVALGIFLFIELIPVVTAFLGRSPTLTGRTILWSDVIRMIQEKPLLGYGLSGFWLGWDGPSARVWLYRTWLPRYAHNGFMDLTLQLGIVGLAFFLYHFLRTSYYSLCWNQRYHNLHDLWPLCFLVYMVVTNIADTSILSRNNLMWILYLSLTLTMIIHQRQPEIPKNGESILPELQTNLAAPST
jgi:O-antigen ligase